MIFGFNTDVNRKDAVYHVQTEDRGARNPVIESTIYVGGKILERRRTPYVPGESSREQIEEAVRRQHKELVDSIRTGTWAPAGEVAAKPSSPPQGYAIELLNASDILDGEHLRFRFSVREKAQNKGAGEVSLEVRWLLGGSVAEKQSLKSAADGSAEVLFPMPEDHIYAALLVCAQGPGGRELAKYHVRGSSP